MEKKNTRRGKQPNKPGRQNMGRFVQLPFWFLNSPAWMSLSDKSIRLYIELKRRFNGCNNGDIPLSHRDAAKKLNCSVKPITKAFKELEDKGFIRPIVKGSFDWKTGPDGGGRATRWLLTEYPQNVPEQSLIARKDFMKWQPLPDQKDSTEKKMRGSILPPRVGENTTIGNTAVRENTTNRSQTYHSKVENSVSAVVPNTTVSNIPCREGVASVTESPSKQETADAEAI